ncbi:MAG: nucleotidyl transferase AbiEii/AbiGii toxin family protein [bacterium]|nr:nucleotidyl transferase AbiEii/AbiGii toxin family protein [bacterium]
MSNIYQNISSYAFEEHREALLSLLKVFGSHSIRFFLIGAQAKDVHFLRQGIKPSRSTQDIDFAVMVDSMQKYDELKAILVDNGFQKTREPYRLDWEEGKTIIDLLPFGHIEENHTVNFDQRHIELSVLGLREVNTEVEKFYFDENSSISIPMPPLHGLFLLKLLSWNEQKLTREKDLQDINQILESYWDFIEEEAYEQHTDLFNDEFEIDRAGARILGRHLQVTVNKSKTLRAQVVKILEEQTAQTGTLGPMLKTMALESGRSIDAVRNMLGEVMIGLKEVT